MRSELLNKPMLLIVDDEKPTREGLRAALEDHYDVWVAEDAKAAMTLLRLTEVRVPYNPKSSKLPGLKKNP